MSQSESEGNAPKRVVITGGSGGIGRSIVAHYLREGAQVVNLDRSAPDSDSAASQAQHISCDFSDAASIVGAFKLLDAHFAGQAPNLLVCAAAIGLTHHFLEVRAQDIDLVMGVNIKGTLLAAQQAARLMCAKKIKGHIVIITSVSAAQGWAQEPLYCISKAAQMSMVQSLAVELAPFGIIVNGIGPGVIDVSSQGMSGNRAFPEIEQHYLDRIPLRRMGTPEEVAHTIAYLGTVTYMTGQTLYMDGGLLASGLAYIGPIREAVLQRLADTDPV